jgi:plasmid stabilization system protein ParE
MTGDLVTFHAEAAAELEAAFDWYAARSRRAADQYLAELDRAITIIVGSPEVGNELLDVATVPSSALPFPDLFSGDSFRN